MDTLNPKRIKKLTNNKSNIGPLDDGCAREKNEKLIKMSRKSKERLAKRKPSLKYGKIGRFRTRRLYSK